MSALRNKKFEYVFHWYFYTKIAVDIFHKFRKLAIFNGVTITELLEQVVYEYVGKKYDAQIGDLDIISEEELIKECHNLGFKTTRRSLNIYRAKNVLVYEDHRGKLVKFWYTDGFSVCYDKQRALGFIKSRKNNPMSRLDKPKESLNGAITSESGNSVIQQPKREASRETSPV